MPKIDALGMAVSDIAASLDFYRLLGLAVPEGAESEGHVDIPLGNGFRLMLDTYETMESFDQDFEPIPGGAMVLAVRCADADEVNRVYDRMIDAGHRSKREPWDAFWGQRYATVVDPDGNPVDLYAPLT